MGKSKELATYAGGTFSTDVILGGSADISMDASSSGQLSIDGNGYNGAIALDSTGMSIYHNSASRSLSLGTNETARLTIDASGRVTMPYQPSFRVVLQTSNGTSSTTTQLVNWGVQHNIGGHFSTSTSRFTAPVSGVYLMNYTGLHSSNGANTGYWVRMYFMINGTAYLDGLGDNGTYGSYQRLSVSAQFYLNAGDYVTTHAQSNQTNSTGVYSGYTHWSGHLIG